MTAFRRFEHPRCICMIFQTDIVSVLPAIAAIQARDKSRHGLVCTASLHLVVRTLALLALATEEHVCGLHTTRQLGIVPHSQRKRVDEFKLRQSRRTKVQKSACLPRRRHCLVSTVYCRDAFGSCKLSSIQRRADNKQIAVVAQTACLSSPLPTVLACVMSAS